MRNTIMWPVAIVIIIILGVLIWISNLNQYQKSGEIEFRTLKQPAMVIRDEKNMPYVYADDLLDAIKVQGYVIAQDRLFQMVLNKLAATGRVSELVGEKGLEFDKRMRTIGLKRNAIRHASILNSGNRRLLQAYTDGINEFITKAKKDHPLEFQLTETEPELWSIVDTISIIYYMGWGSAGNIQNEILAQMIIERIGVKKFKEIYPVATNIDAPKNDQPASITAIQIATSSEKTHFSQDQSLLSYLRSDPFSLKLGSNSWTTDARHSTSGKPILANDPHLDSRMLPGIFYPIGLFYGDMRVIGVTVPGIPGVFIGRNQFVAIGLSNSYGDAQDLYIETIDPSNPNHYLHNGESVPFELIDETIKVREESGKNRFREVPLQVRLTKRGPVISNQLEGLKTNKILSLRWSPFETMLPELGINYLLTARNVSDVRETLKSVTMIHLNAVLADVNNDIAWQTTGKLPIRKNGDGTIPISGNSNEDNWIGWIPYDQMPQQFGSQRGWIGNANNNPVGPDYPYYLSSYFAPYYRYQRITELMASKKKKSPLDHWYFQRDDLNVIARKLVPIFVRVLKTDPETKILGEVLDKWDFRDDLNRVEPTIYHRIYDRLAYLTFHDELGSELATNMLKEWNFWQERFELMVTIQDSNWFDDQSTSNNRETLDSLLIRAAKEVQTELSEEIDTDIGAWRWGKVHKVEFSNPIRQQGIGKHLAGASVSAVGGSGDTLYRAIYHYDKPNKVHLMAALRMVVDLNDHEKVMAVISGGVTGRTFSSHFKDQLKPYKKGTPKYWWFSDAMIRQYKRSELTFHP